jgi:hypothetical protein
VIQLIVMSQAACFNSTQLTLIMKRVDIKREPLRAEYEGGYRICSGERPLGLALARRRAEPRGALRELTGGVRLAVHAAHENGLELLAAEVDEEFGRALVQPKRHLTLAALVDLIRGLVEAHVERVLCRGRWWARV